MQAGSSSTEFMGIQLLEREERGQACQPAVSCCLLRSCAVSVDWRPHVRCRHDLLQCCGPWALIQSPVSVISNHAGILDRIPGLHSAVQMKTVDRCHW